MTAEAPDIRSGQTGLLGRTVYGREMATAVLNCQINTQSVPDGTALSKLITLSSPRAERHLRHGIYEHVDCAETVAGWASEQLRAKN